MGTGSNSADLGWRGWAVGVCCCGAGVVSALLMGADLTKVGPPCEPLPGAA